MDYADTAEASDTHPRSSRILIACTRCRARKARCDGATPKCNQCVTNDAECTYPAVRRTRGPGKKKKNVDNLRRHQESPLSRSITEDKISHTPNNTPFTDSPIPSSSTREESSTRTREPAPSQSTTFPSHPHGNSKNPVPIVADFLFPGAFDQNLQTLKGQIGGANPRQRLTPLLPQRIATRLIQNSYAEVMAECELMDLSSFAALLGAQYATSTTEPGNNPARWAVVNAIIALAIRNKTAPGSETELSDIPSGFYHNATVVIPDLILQAPSLLSVQALLAMGMFARNILDFHASTVLATNASYQLKTIALKHLFVNEAHDIHEVKQYENAYAITQTLECAASQAYSFDEPSS